MECVSLQPHAATWVQAKWRQRVKVHGFGATQSAGLTDRMKCLKRPCRSWPHRQRSLSQHCQVPSTLKRQALSKAGEIPGGGLQGRGVRSLYEMLVSAHPTLLRRPLQQDIESPLPYGEPWNTKVTQYGAAPGSSSATKSFSGEFYWGACVCVCVSSSGTHLPPEKGLLHPSH